MRNMKKAVSILLALVMTMSLLPLSAAAETGYYMGELSNTEVTVIDGNAPILQQYAYKYNSVTDILEDHEYINWNLSAVNGPGVYTVYGAVDGFDKVYETKVTVLPCTEAIDETLKYYGRQDSSMQAHMFQNSYSEEIHIEFDLTYNFGSDGVVAFSNQSAVYGPEAIALHFNGTLASRNGNGSGGADWNRFYEPVNGGVYHYHIVTNPSKCTWSADVTDADGFVTMAADNYGYRTNQNSIDRVILNRNTSTDAYVDDIEVRNLKISRPSDYVAVTGIESDAAIEISEGKSSEANVTMLPKNASNKNYSWTSSDENVAIVENGMITALSEGEATITFTAADGGYSAQTKVTVLPGTTIRLSQNEATMKIGEELRIEADVKPEGTAVVWTSSDESVVTVENGVITARKKGSVNIVAATTDGEVYDSCTVEVLQGVEGIELDRHELTITLDQGWTYSYGEIYASILPGDADNRNITWSSSNEDVALIAAVGENGVLICGCNSGTAVLTCTTEDGGYQDSCIVSVVRRVSSVSLDKTTVVVDVGKSFVLTETVLPEDADDKSVVWTTSDESIAFVEDGVVTGISEGEAVITVTTNDGSLTAQCAVTVGDMSTDGLIAYYDFENEGIVPNEITDVSGNGNNAAVLNASDSNLLTIKDGVAYFPGNKTSAELGTALRLPNDINQNVSDFTYSAWIYADSSYTRGNGMRFFDFGNIANGSAYNSIFARYMPSTGELYVTDRNVNKPVSKTFSDKPFSDKWGMLTFVMKYDSNYRAYGVTTYVNGTAVEELSPPSHVRDFTRSIADLGTLSDSTNGLFIGRTVWGAVGAAVQDNPDFCGMMDEIRLYDRALDKSEVEALYNAYSPYEESDLSALSEVSVTASEDTMVVSSDGAWTNYGSVQEIMASDVGAARTRYGLFRFDLSDSADYVDKSEKIVLRLYSTHIDNEGTNNYYCYALKDDFNSWEADTVTWNDLWFREFVSTGGLFDYAEPLDIRQAKLRTTGAYMEWDITDFVKENTNENFSLLLTASSNAAYFASSEYGDETKAPAIVMYVESVPVTVNYFVDGELYDSKIVQKAHGSEFVMPEIDDLGVMYEFDRIDGAVGGVGESFTVEEAAAINVHYTRKTTLEGTMTASLRASDMNGENLTLTVEAEVFNLSNRDETVKLDIVDYDEKGRSTVLYEDVLTLSAATAEIKRITAEVSLAFEQCDNIEILLWTGGLRPLTKAISASDLEVKSYLPDEVMNMMPTYGSAVEAIRKANGYWQSVNPYPWSDTNGGTHAAFWDKAAYQTGNIEVYKLLGDESDLNYSLEWANYCDWKGNNYTGDPSNWTWGYNQNQGSSAVIFGDWQICFQTFLDLYELGAEGADISRVEEVMSYQISTDEDSYWWWADSLYMVMPVMVKMYKLTDNETYLYKLYEWFKYAKELMYDGEGGIPASAEGYTTSASLTNGARYSDPEDYKHLFYRDAGYVYPLNPNPGHTNEKNFWARGNGWVFAALAKVLADMPADFEHYDEFYNTYMEMAAAIIACQETDSEGHGFWTQSMLQNYPTGSNGNNEGYETSGTAFFTYGLFWGINNGILDEETYLEPAVRAWGYLSEVAMQSDGRIGYVQPIGGNATQATAQSTTQNFGVGAFLLAGCEAARWAK